MPLSRPRPVLVAATAALSLGLAACGSSSSSSSTKTSPPASTAAAPTTTAAAGTPSTAGPASGAVKVDIANFKYVPATLTVKTGARVTFTNSDSAPHTATARNSAFDTGTLMKGQSRTLTLSKPGSYAIYCTFHPFMSGTVVVK